jgi:exosortase/archaeosortase family protein
VGKSGSDKKTGRQEARRRSRDESARSGRRERIARRKQRGVRVAGTSWFALKGRVLCFVLLLVVFMVGFNALFFTWLAPGDFFQNYLKANAEVCAGVLRFLGDDATTSGISLASSRFSLNIRRGCDGIQVSAFLCFAILAWPISVPLWRRAIGLAIGTLLLLTLNLVRIVSLYYIGIYFPSAFSTMHTDVWQATFVVLALFLWVIWLWWATPAATGKVDVAA